MQPIVVSVGPLVASSANNIALSQTPGAAGALTPNGSTVVSGVAVLDKPRQVLITTTGDEHTKSFIITGTDWAGSPISETISGIASGTTKASVLSYATVTSITISAAAAGALTVGTNGVASSSWVRLDGWANPSVSKQCVVSGTVNYTVQYSNDDPNAIQGTPVNPNAMNWFNDMNTEFVGATASQFDLWAFVPLWVRLVLNSGTGSVTMTLQQTGAAPR
jgi:hypothetical protein